MKNRNLVLVILLSSSFSFTDANAATGGSQSDPNLSYTCATLQANGSNYRTFCAAFSPSATLYNLWIYGNIRGTTSGSTCLAYSYNDQTDDEFVSPYTTEILGFEWGHTGGYSYSEDFYVLAHWDFSEWGGDVRCGAGKSLLPKCCRALLLTGLVLVAPAPL